VLDYLLFKTNKERIKTTLVIGQYVPLVYGGNA
jgi:hypothetical protein